MTAPPAVAPWTDEAFLRSQWIVPDAEPEREPLAIYDRGAALVFEPLPPLTWRDWLKLAAGVMAVFLVMASGIAAVLALGVALERICR
jgi:hypothetical protein